MARAAREQAVRRHDRRGGSDAADRSRRLLAIPVLLLLLSALASNIYLAHLYVRVNQAPGQSVDSFCNLTETVNCANVSATRYASFLEVPVALFGAEFYGLAALVLLLSLTRLWSLESWDSLLFWAMLAALPASAVMAYISAFVIRMLCPLCSLVYGVNLLVLLLIVIARRSELGELLRAGPRELRAALAKGPFRTVVVLVLLVGVSQLFWVPRLMGQPSAGEHGQGAAAHAETTFPAGGRVVGPPDAPVKIIEFSDFQCSICSHAHEVMVQLLKQTGDRVHFRHFDYPLDMACNRKVTRPFHTDACRAAYYARCADEQQRFWPFSAQLFANQHNLARGDLRRFAEQVGIDATRLEACVAATQTRNAVLTEIEEGIRRDVTGTPTFFINGEKIVGPRDVQFWLTKVDELAAKANSPAR